MLDTLRRAWKIGDLRARILFTAAMLVVFRLGAHVPVPGIDSKIIQEMFKEGTLFGLLDLFSGGALKAFSIFAMSITPYINSSIIMQLLTLVIPKLEQLSKEGEEGRRKIQQYVRYGTVVLGLIQAIGMSIGLRNAVISPGFWSYTVIAISLTAGTAFLMWLGEMITDRGIGNGISLLIFAGIVSRLPGGAANIYQYLRAGRISFFNLFLLSVIGVAVIAAVVLIQEGQRKIPVQYAKRVVGRKIYGGQSSFIPMRINQAGVIPVIFAASVLAFPVTVASFFHTGWAAAIERYFGFRTPLYTALYALLIIFFTYFYTAVTFNPMDVANNIKKYGGFIPGLRPGRPTAEYLGRVLERITLPGAIFLAAIAVLPNFVMIVTDIPGLYFGGTALLIVVGVALETMKQIEAHLLMRHYQGFVK